MPLLVAFVTFIVATAICLLIWLSFGSDSRQEVVQRRMEAVHRAEQRGPVDLGVQLVRDEMMSGVPALNQLMMKWSWSLKFKDFVSQAGMNIRPGRILLICGAMGVCGFLAARAVTSTPSSILIAMIAAIV